MDQTPKFRHAKLEVKCGDKCLSPTALGWPTMLFLMGKEENSALMNYSVEALGTLIMLTY